MSGESENTVSVEYESLVRKHPDYDRQLLHWQFLEATYFGGRGWFDTNIHRFEKEGKKRYDSRIKRAYRFNHTREIVDLVTKYVFKAEISRKEDAPQPVRDFWKRATRGGKDVDALMRQASQMTSVFGQPYIVVDNSAKPVEEGGPVTVSDQKKVGAAVYAYCVKPENAINMSFDEFGILNWILFREITRDDNDFMASTHETVQQYRLWTRSEWRLFEVEEPDGVSKPKVRGRGKAKAKLQVKQVGHGVHELGRVPVIVPRERYSDSFYTAPGLIDDIAYLDRAVANYLSNLDAIIQDQTFSTLTIPAQALNSAESGDSIRKRAIQMGTEAIIVYDAEAGVPPSYISPDPQQIEIILAVITKIITEIYHSVGMAGERTKMDNSAGIDNSSGVAKAYDFDRMNTMLKSKADTLQMIENELVELTLLWHGESVPENNIVSYPEEFDVRNLYDEFDVANRLALMDAPDDARRHQMQILLEKLFPNLSEELKDAFLKQLKNWPPEEEATSIRAPSRVQDRTVDPQENRQGQAGDED